MIEACKAGKDVYCEKPLTRTVLEGRVIADTAQQYGRILQTGSHERSNHKARYVADLVRNGYLGWIERVEVNMPNTSHSRIPIQQPSEPPAELDYDLWLGPAPEVPFNANRFGVFLNPQLEYQAWATWRYFMDYGGGMMTDWGVHLLDIVHWAMDVDAPETVTAVGDRLHIGDNRDTPDTLNVLYRYPGFVATYENRQLNGHALEGRGYGIMFHGTSGTMVIDRGGYTITPEPGSDLEPTTNTNNDTPVSHQRRFLDAMRTRERPNSDIEIGHRSTSAAMLGNVAYLSGRTIQWDGQNEQVIGDPDANRLLDKPYRAPWVLSSL